MKKLWILGIAAYLISALAGCSSKADVTSAPSMYIQPAQLTEEEENITKLVGADTHHIFDFAADDSIQSVQVNTYQLKDGAWDLISGGGGYAFSDLSGRLALDFGKILDGLRVALQSEHTNGGYSHVSNPENDFHGMGCATSLLSSKTDIVYEQEIPLAIQIITAKNEITSYTVEYFNQPELYTEYEYVYAITVLFSQKTVTELSENK